MTSQPSSTPVRRRRATRVWALALMCLSLLAGGLTPVTGAPAAAATCPCSVFPPTAVPAVQADPETSAVELGMKFRADTDGFVTGVRFHKAAANTGTHLGRLWDAQGTLLATATFTDETASGWQQVLFSAPVAVTAGRTYVVSYYAPVGRYSVSSNFFAGTGVDASPLRALQDGEDGANGVYRYGTGGGFPTNSWQAANYWVDVVFETSAVDTTPPTVTTRSPAAGATDVPVSTSVSASFSEPVQGADIAVAAGGSPVAGSTDYDSATRTATFTPSSALALSTSHTVTVSGAQDAAGNAMATDTWTFTTASSTATTSTLWPDSATPATPSVADGNPVELGVKFRTSTDGFITGLRFYKGPQNTGQHVGTLWSSSGQALGSATFTGETASGWQSVRLPAPVAVTAGTTYVASYHTTSGFYSANTDGFLADGVTRGPLTALRSGVDGGNGVYRYGGGGFPTNTYRATNYWVDVQFQTSATDTVAPTVTARVPAADATGVSTGTTVAATFSEPVTASSIQMELRDGTTTVPAAQSYDATTRTVTLTPTNPLGAGRSYTVSVTGATDPAGNTMGDTGWSFSTANAPTTPPTQGPGGPVLVVTNSSSSDAAFAPFTAEILRAEGLNSFATAQLSTVTAQVLAGYDVVVLGRTPLTAAQVQMLTTWVEGGGNLIAFRPTASLGGLLGLSGPGTAANERYLKVDTSSAPGQGITAETLQTHGAADQWTLDGARAVATLYSNATTATSAPAVTLRSVGTNGGEAAAFTFDLPQSIVYTRQGNPAWDGLNRDSSPVIRSNDLYFGGNAADWVDLSKVAVPQADEQQRLLANLVLHVNRDRKPLPRFAYFPDAAKAVVLATGDDHAGGGTAGRFDQYLANSVAGCSVADWACLRFSSYVFTDTALTAEQARAYHGQGFEVGLHPQNGCTNYTANNLGATYTNGLASWASKYTGLPSPSTSRYHCIVWSDWASQAKASLQNGIRLDTNYYYWPGNWVADRPGFMTGSGMPMRFVDTDGTMIDVYQAATQMTDESDQSYPFTPNALLDAALGPQGYYGAFTANMHTDQATIWQDDQLIESARQRGVPVIASRQMLTWLDGRNASTFRDLRWEGQTLTFDLAVGQGASGLTALVPLAGPAGALQGVTRAGAPVSWTPVTVKGIEYAQFLAQPGAHSATYGSTAPGATTADITTADITTADITTADITSTETASTLSAQRVSTADVTLLGTASGEVVSAAPVTPAVAPAISDLDVFPLPDGTTQVSWTTDVKADSTVTYGTESGELTERLYSGTRTRRHAVVLTRLDPDTTYYLRVSSADAAGDRTSFPAGSAQPVALVTPAHGVADRSAAQFRMRRGGNGVYLRQDVFGELSLTPADGQEFDRPVFPPGWTREPEAVRGVLSVTGGRLLLDGQRAGRQGTTPAGGTVDFNATFSGTGPQWGGWATGAPQAPLAMFELRDGRLYATVQAAGGQASSVPLATDLVGTERDYRVESSRTGARFFVDGRQVASLQGSLPAMRPQFRDVAQDGTALEVAWVRVAGYGGSESFESRVMDAAEMVAWDRATWRADVPAGTSLRVSVRLGSTPQPDGSWSAWTALSGPGARVVGESRYLQYRVELSSTAARSTPVLRGIGFTNNGTPAPHIGEVGEP